MYTECLDGLLGGGGEECPFISSPPRTSGERRRPGADFALRVQVKRRSVKVRGMLAGARSLLNNNVENTSEKKLTRVFVYMSR